MGLANLIGSPTMSWWLGGLVACGLVFFLVCELYLKMKNGMDTDAQRSSMEVI